MGDRMRHGNYAAEIEYHEDAVDGDAGFLGRIVDGPLRNAADQVLFRGRSVDELRQDFAGQVAFYESGAAASAH